MADFSWNYSLVRVASGQKMGSPFQDLTDHLTGADRGSLNYQRGEAMGLLFGILGLGGSGRVASEATRGASTAHKAANTTTRVADDAFEHGYRYHPRIRERWLEDPRAHNFPYSFDDVILREKPITQADGSLLYRKPRDVSGRSGIYEIALNPDTGIIFHRT